MMQHRVPALRVALVATIVFSIMAFWHPIAAAGGIVQALFGLFLLSPLADWVERQER